MAFSDMAKRIYMLSIGMKRQRILSLTGSKPFKKPWQKAGRHETTHVRENVEIVHAATLAPTH
jgi:hypothetical protein